MLLPRGQASESSGKVMVTRHDSWGVARGKTIYQNLMKTKCLITSLKMK